MKLKRKIPKRMCLGCRQMIPKNELTRIVRLSDGSVEIDRTGKKPGRGTYVCRNLECRKKALKPEYLNKALNTTITLDIVSHLRKDLENNEV